MPAGEVMPPEPVLIGGGVAGIAECGPAGEPFAGGDGDLPEAFAFDWSRLAGSRGVPGGIGLGLAGLSLAAFPGFPGFLADGWALVLAWRLVARLAVVQFLIGLQDPGITAIEGPQAVAAAILDGGGRGNAAPGCDAGDQVYWVLGFPVLQDGDPVEPLRRPPAAFSRQRAIGAEDREKLPGGLQAGSGGWFAQSSLAALSNGSSGLT